MDRALISIDTNLLLYSLNQDCPEFAPARKFITELGTSQNVAICELVLVELYLLLRNPAVVRAPYSAQDAAETCQVFRRNPHWRLIASGPIMKHVWHRAATAGIARRSIIDARLAFTLRHHGVTHFATRNTADFQDFDFERVWNPLDEV